MTISSFLCVSVAGLAALSAARAAVDFEKDVQPILEVNCVRCHNPNGSPVKDGKTDLDLTSRETATADGESIIPGDAAKSKLYRFVMFPDDADNVMPPKNKATGARERLSKEQMEILRNWINEGAAWPAGKKLIARKTSGEPAARN